LRRSPLGDVLDEMSLAGPGVLDMRNLKWCEEIAIEE